MRSRIQRIILICIILVACVGCDQATKVLAKKSLAYHPPISYYHDTFRLQYAENSGAFLSIGSSLSPTHRFGVFTVATGLALGAMAAYLLFAEAVGLILVTGLSLVIAGGTGNLIDRIMNNGAVIDFMNVGIGSLRTGIFNVADVAIMAGTILLLVSCSGLGEKHALRKIR